MLGKLFNRGTTARNPVADAMATAPVLLDQLLEALSDARGIRIEAATGALGALAGHAAQHAAMHGLSGRDPAYARLSLTQVTGANGEIYWFGDAVNHPVAEGNFSLWHAVIAAAEERPGRVPPVLAPIFADIAARIGSESFGDQRGAIARFWPAQADILDARARDPKAWPIAYGFAFTQLIAMVGDQFDFSELAATFMRSVVIASKLQV